MRLLLVTESFPPLDNIAAQRFAPMIPVLEARGIEVWVLTQEAEGGLRVPLPEERIIRIGRHHQAGVRVRTGSKFARGSRRRELVRTLVQLPGVQLRAANSTLFTWYRPVMRALPAIRSRLAAVDLVIGTYPPPAALFLARRLARVFGVPWIADFRDPGALRPDGRSARVCRLDRAVEGRLLASAAAVTTCGEDWAAMHGRAYGRPTRVLYNGFDREVLVGRDLPVPDDLPEGPFLHFAGRFYERQMAAVARLLEAVRGTPFRVVLRSLGPPEREAEIRAMTDSQGLAGQVELRPPVPLARVAAEARRASANLVLETVAGEEAWIRGHLSGKFLQLLPLDPPVIYVGRPDAEAGDILRRTGGGVLCTTVGDIRAALERLRAGGGWPRDEAAILEFAKPRQGERLAALVEETVAGAAADGRSSTRPAR